MEKQKKQKIYALVIGLILVLVCILFFFLDTSLEWNYYKIVSCVVISIWIFFIPPTILYYHYKSKNSTMEYNIRLGISIGTGCFLGLLVAPIVGCIAYFSNLDDIKDK